jgi:hypothetical protein
MAMLFVAVSALVITVVHASTAGAAPVCFDLVGNIIPCESSASSTTARPTTTTVAPTTTTAAATTSSAAVTTTSSTAAPTSTTAAAARQVRAAPAVTLRPPSDPSEPSSKAKTYAAVAAVSFLLLVALVGPELRAWSRRRRSRPAAGS